MTLKDLIKALERSDKGICKVGFTRPHSYRGYYSQLAFDPLPNACVATMLQEAKAALGATYMGWKGGEYTMTGDTEVWLAEDGCLGEPLTALAISYMLDIPYEEIEENAMYLER